MDACSRVSVWMYLQFCVLCARVYVRFQPFVGYMLMFAYDVCLHMHVHVHWFPCVLSVCGELRVSGGCCVEVCSLTTLCAWTCDGEQMQFHPWRVVVAYLEPNPCGSCTSS